MKLHYYYRVFTSLTFPLWLRQLKVCFEICFSKKAFEFRRLFKVQYRWKTSRICRKLVDLSICVEKTSKIWHRKSVEKQTSKFLRFSTLFRRQKNTFDYVYKAILAFLFGKDTLIKWCCEIIAIVIRFVGIFSIRWVVDHSFRIKEHWYTCKR